MPMIEVATEDTPFHCEKVKDKVGGKRLIGMITVKNNCIDGDCPFFSQYGKGKLLCTFNKLAKETE